MGSKNSFRKRKARNAVSLKRRRSARESYAKILIVCEGQKTEPKYFNDARNYYGLNTVNVEVRGDGGSAPMSIINFAKELYREAQQAGDAFDKVFCVFDRDQHSTYPEAMQKLSTITPKKTYFAVNSIPSFEYWLLLHFDYSTKPYQPTPTKSTGDLVLQDLKKHLPDYEKNNSTLFRDLIDKVETAKTNARRVLKECELNDTDNPSTKIHELVEFLQDIKK